MELGGWLIFGAIAAFYKSNQEGSKFYIPIPDINVNSIPLESDRIVHLNKIAKMIDYLYRNFLKSRKNSGMETLIKRIRPIFLMIKFEIAKKLALDDLNDVLSAISLEIQIRREQIQQIMKRIPAYTPFISTKKYSPYFWVLTEKEMTYFMNRSSTYHSESVSLYELDDFIKTDGMKLRYWTLMRRYHDKLPIKIDPADQVSTFEDYCQAILAKRYTISQDMIEGVRKEIRSFQRERSKYTFQANRLSRLKLSDWPGK